VIAVGLVVGAAWAAVAIPTAIAIGRAIRRADQHARGVVPHGHAAGRADLQLTHLPEQEQK
jgi:hypothetical protein